MRKLILGALVSGLATWLYQSTQTRERLRQQLTTAPAILREAVVSMVSATTSSAQRVAQTIDGTPLPPQAKERARTAAAALQSAAEKMTQQIAGSASDHQPVAQPYTPAVMESLIPEEVRAEQDAAEQASAEAQKERQSGG